MFLYENMQLGGIETNLIDMIQIYHQQKRRIIWLRYGKESDIFEQWKDVLQACEVEIVATQISSQCWFQHENISFQEGEQIHAVAFSPQDFVRLESLTQEYPSVQFDLHYIVPHFKMERYYLEDLYWGIERTVIRKSLAKVYMKWYQNGCLSFFGKAHEKEMYLRYSIPCLNDDDNLFKKVKMVEPFDRKHAEVMAKCRQENFTIVTCGRFDFPHKAYMFGLVEAFLKLKIKYPQLQLKIVGYGDELNEKKIRDYVLRKTNGQERDISFLGPVSPKNMVNVFHSAHVNISVAGGTLAGCRAGLVSLAVRHYSYDCEVYGWMSKNNSSTLRSDPGESVVGYIEDLINMDSEMYVEKCFLSYEAVKQNENDPNWLFNRHNIKKNYYDIRDTKLMKKIYKRTNAIVRSHDVIRIVLSKMRLLDIARRIHKRKLMI